MIAPALAQALPGERPLELLAPPRRDGARPARARHAHLLPQGGGGPLGPALGARRAAGAAQRRRHRAGAARHPARHAAGRRGLLGALAGGPRPRGPEESLAAGARAAEPLRAFLARFAAPADRRAFALLAARARGRPRPGTTGDDEGFGVLAPAFVVSELRRAFTIGFLVFLPFLVVDLAVASVLLSLGLTQLSPTAVAVPFKLLLLVAVDGFGIVTRGLAAGYLP